MRIYDVCRPQEPPEEYRVGASSTEAPTKLAWSPIDDSSIILGRRSGQVEKWDFRVRPAAGPAAGITMPGDANNIMDIQLIEAHNIMLVAAGKKICAYSLDDFQLLKEFDMPSPLTFKEEGGAALSPDGTKMLAVSRSISNCKHTSDL